MYKYVCQVMIFIMKCLEVRPVGCCLKHRARDPTGNNHVMMYIRIIHCMRRLHNLEYLYVVFTGICCFMYIRDPAALFSEEFPREFC